MSSQKCVALIAHDEKKADLAAFAKAHERVLSQPLSREPQFGFGRKGVAAEFRCERAHAVVLRENAVRLPI